MYGIDNKNNNNKNSNNNDSNNSNKSTNNNNNDLRVWGLGGGLGDFRLVTLVGISARVCQSRGALTSQRRCDDRDSRKP